MMLTQHSPGLAHSLLAVQLVAEATLLEVELVEELLEELLEELDVELVELVVLVVELVVEVVSVLDVVFVFVDVGALPPNSPSSPSAQLDNPIANTQVTPAAKRQALAPRPHVVGMLGEYLVVRP